MNNLLQLCGYDDNIFITEVPDYFFCIVCHLVLNKPKLILSCGHKMCTPCFERFRTYSSKNNQPLVCPVDRKEIDVADVVPDVGTEREIGNLRVVCLNEANDCKWQGDLRELSIHVEKCVEKASNNGEEETSQKMLKGILERLEKIEVQFAERENEIAVLKKENHDMKVDVLELRKENGMLKESQGNLERKLTELTFRFQTDIDEVSFKPNAKTADSNKDVENFKVECNTTSGKSGVSSSDNIGTTQVVMKKNLSVRPFFDIEIDGKLAGRITFDLYSNAAPQTCQKFVHLCTQQYGCSYRGTTFNAVLADYCLVGYHLMSDTGTPLDCTRTFFTPKENMHAKHNKKGLLSMEVWTGDITRSNFYILFKPCVGMNGQSVVFGEVSNDTWYVVKKMKKTSGGLQIKIVHCGIE